MVHNPEKLEMATYYRKRGFSYSEIANLCGVSKSTVSNWLAKKKFSKSVKADNIRKAARENSDRIRLVTKARQAERTKRYVEAIRSAETEFRNYKNDPAFLSGVLLYKAVGDLSHPSRIRFSTNNAQLHTIFIRFACNYLGVDKKTIKCWLLLHVNQSITVEERWWAKQLKLSPAQFGKSQRIESRTELLHNVTGNTIIGNTVLKRKLIRWTELATKQLAK